jgi:SAM-dependent methyltransferase
MSKEYDQITAFHYAAYRPSLHSDILKAYFRKAVKVKTGLDVGCGTGHSSIALTAYCDRVIGIDPSQEMLQKAITNPSVQYTLYDLNAIDFSADHFDIITFAGSLYYAKSQHILNDIVRVSKRAAKIVVYDFELFLDEILNLLSRETYTKQITAYDHQTNFTGLDQTNIRIEKELKRMIDVEISLSNLAHVLLSSKDNYGLLVEFYGEDDLYNKIVEKLHAVLNTEKATIRAMTYLTVYEVTK